MNFPINILKAYKDGFNYIVINRDEEKPLIDFFKTEEEAVKVLNFARPGTEIYNMNSARKHPELFSFESNGIYFSLKELDLLKDFSWVSEKFPLSEFAINKNCPYIVVKMGYLYAIKKYSMVGDANLALKKFDKTDLHAEVINGEKMINKYSSIFFFPPF